MPDNNKASRAQSGEDSARRIDLNPFPATAVARLTSPEDEFWSIETDALKQARIQLTAYLDRATTPSTSSSSPKGLAIAIVGDYGTGKTHIAQELLRQIDARQDFRLHPLYLDAPSDTFLALYRQRFMQKLSRAEVLRRVDELYTDIIVRELERSPVTAPLASLLQSRKVAPDELVKKVGLMESRLKRELGTELQHVTERNDFGTALLLFRRPEFQAAVWEWLAGEPPDPVLRERGIELHIDSDASALEAIGVMSFLFGRQGHRFILFVDELEKVFTQSDSRRPDAAAILAFKKLMEAIGETGALLVLVGLPECLDILPEDARQRISAVIRPSAIASTEIEGYIREASRRAFGEPKLEPFTKDTVEYLAEIAGGNARRVVRLCYHAYLAATSTGSHITRAMLREIAREQFELSAPGDVELEIVRCIEARGWLFEKGKPLKGNKKVQADFWLPLGSAKLGILIFIAQSILQEADVQSVVERTKRGADVGVETVLVVNGYLADNLRQALDAVVTKVVVFRVRDFRDDLDAVLTGIRVRLQEQNRQSVIDQIRDGVEVISRQNSSFEARVSGLLETRLTRADLQHAVSTGLRAVFGQLASNSLGSEAQFPAVAALFDGAQQTLDQVLQVDAFFDLGLGIPISQHRSRFLQQVGRSPRNSEMYFDMFIDNRPLATAQMYIGALQTFRRGVFLLLGNRSLYDPAFEKSGQWMDELMYLCRMFDSLSRRFDISELVSDLRTSAHRLIREKSVEELAELPIWNLGKSASVRAQEVLQELGHSVWQAARHAMELEGARPML